MSGYNDQYYDQDGGQNYQNQGYQKNQNYDNANYDQYGAGDMTAQYQAAQANAQYSDPNGYDYSQQDQNQGWDQNQGYEYNQGGHQQDDQIAPAQSEIQPQASGSQKKKKKVQVEVPEEDEEEKFSDTKGADLKDRSGTIAGAPLADQFDEDEGIEGPDFSEAGMANSKAQAGRKTLTSMYKCNTGKMFMKILASEQRGKGTNVHTQYHIKGEDSIGEIDVFRRYREFDLLYEALFKRYPGLYIPPLPPKANSGTKKELFIDERQYFLDQFLRKIAKLSFLAKTPELQIFLRPQGKCEESIKCLARTNTDQVLQFYQRNIKLPQDHTPETQLLAYNEQIIAFIKDQKELMKNLSEFKSYITQIVPMKEQELQYYKQFTGFLCKYEDAAAAQVSKQDAQQKNPLDDVHLVKGDNDNNLEKKLGQLAEELQNPFKHVRNWIKGEIFNLNALTSAVAEKESCESRKQNAIKRIAADRETNNKLSEGKFTFKTMFKSKNDKAKTQAILLERIAQSERDVENWDKIKRFLIVYIAEVCIPDFKRSRQQKYIKAMQGFSSEELQNSMKHQTCWNDFYNLTKGYNTENW